MEPVAAELVSKPVVKSLARSLSKPVVKSVVEFSVGAGCGTCGS